MPRLYSEKRQKEACLAASGEIASFSTGLLPRLTELFVHSEIINSVAVSILHMVIPSLFSSAPHSSIRHSKNLAASQPRVPLAPRHYSRIATKAHQHVGDLAASHGERYG